MMYRLITCKNGHQLSAYDVSRTENAGLYALAKDIEGYLRNGYRVMIEDIKARKYILVSNKETISVQLVEVEPVTFTRFVDMPTDPDEITQKIIVITPEAAQNS